MLFTLISLVSSDSIEKYIDTGIQYINYCATANIQYSIRSNSLKDKLLVILNQLTPGIEFVYEFPPGTGLNKITAKNPAVLFPDGIVELSVNLTGGQCFGLSYLFIPNTYCETGIKVSTENSTSYRFSTKAKAQDTCFVFAPASTNLKYRIPSYDLGTSKLTTYHEVLDGKEYDKYYGNSSIDWQPSSVRPWLIRLETYSEEYDGYAAVEMEAKNISENSVSFNGEPLTVQFKSNGSFTRWGWAIFLALLAPLVLLAGNIRACWSIYKKRE